MSRCERFWKYYIKGEYHCDTCPFGWEERGLEDADAGCYIKGEIQDTCRLLPPFRFLIGWGRRKKALYYLNHQYDDMDEWYCEQYRKDQAVMEILEPYLGDLATIQNPEFMKPGEKSPSPLIYDIRHKLEDALIPVKYVPLKIRWKELTKDTWNRFLMIFKPYFCK
ncbi:MAG: hypothetical protein IJL30_06975 [Clostridia bacterium]|nr:hypothetical protein [Clostridia bacterium]